MINQNSKEKLEILNSMVELEEIVTLADFD